MRLFRRRVQQDPGRQEALLHEVRHRFGGQAPLPFADQAEAVTRVLEGDDGLIVAALVLREFADSAHAHLLGQIADLNERTRQGFAVDRRNYRPLWRVAGRQLRWPLFELRCGLHPYVQISAAATVVGARARRVVKVTDPAYLLGDLFEVLDLTTVGWEFGRLPADADSIALADRLIVATRALHDAMGEPPPLPPPVRELMRRNNTVGGYNPGKRMREVLLT